MSDQDDVHGPEADAEDQAVAAERLERALERIAASAHRAAAGGGVAVGERPVTGEPIMDPGRTREVAARLDALIAELRTALDRD